MKLSTFAPASIRLLLAELEEEATGFVRYCSPIAEIQAESQVYRRYSGQGSEIPVALSAEQAKQPDAATFQSLFEVDYESLFGRIVDGMDIEITVWAVNATTPVEYVPPVDVVTNTSDAVIDSTRTLFDAAVGQMVEASVVLRGAMQAGHAVAGPAIITEDETTIIVPGSRKAVRQPDGCIDIVLND